MTSTELKASGIEFKVDDYLSLEVCSDEVSLILLNYDDSCLSEVLIVITMV